MISVKPLNILSAVNVKLTLSGAVILNPSDCKEKLVLSLKIELKRVSISSCREKLLSKFVKLVDI